MKLRVVDRLKNLRSIAKSSRFSVFSIAKTLIQRHFAAVRMLEADESLLASIAFHLENTPKSWLIPIPSDDWYHEILADIEEVLPGLNKTRPFLTVNAAQRWVLVRDDYLVPVIFTNRGGATCVYRLICGTGFGWAMVINDALVKMITTGAYVLEEDEPTFTDVAAPRLPVRDGKWEVTGVHLL